MILSWLVGSFCCPPLGCLRKYGFKTDEKRIKLFQEWENNFKFFKIRGNASANFMKCR